MHPSSGDLAEYEHSRDAALRQFSSDAGFVGVVIDLFDLVDSWRT